MSPEDKFGCLFSPLERLESFSDLKASLASGGVTAMYGPDDTQRAHILAAAQRASGRPMLILTATDMLAQRIMEDMNILLGGGCVFLPTKDISFVKSAATSRELSMRRLEALGAAAMGDVKALVVPVDALMHRLMPRAKFVEHVMEIDDGMVMDPEEMITRLVEAGYERVQLVEGRGQCALRGGILDVYSVGEANALRIEFFDDEIDSIRTFDVMTQRSISRRSSARIYPAGEVLLTGDDFLKAAHELEYMLRSRSGALKTDDRQKRIEEEFDLMPVEDFLELAYTGAGDDELPGLDDLFIRKPKKKKTEEKPAKKTAKKTTAKKSSKKTGGKKA